MTHAWFIGFLSTFVGIGTGGLIARFINGFKKSIGTIYGLCTGMILGLISIEIVPEALQLGNWLFFLFGFLAGILLFKLLHIGFHDKSGTSRGLDKHNNKRLGFFLALIISIHNLPMGIVLGAGDESELSIALLQALILHNVPEGMILFTPLFIAGFSTYMLFFISIIVAVPVGIGAFIGELIGMQNQLLWGFLISLTVGTIYMVAIKEILTESTRQSSNIYSLLTALIGFCLMGAYLIYF